VDAIDTNILVRYIVADDEFQHKQAVSLIESGDPKLINPIVLVEFSWVLQSVYSLSREVIAETMKMIGSCGYFMYKRPGPVKLAIQHFVNGLDLTDALIVGTNKDDGALVTYTFDKKAARMDGYRLLDFTE